MQKKATHTKKARQKVNNSEITQIMIGRKRREEALKKAELFLSL
jgi:hypothetical protein